MRFTHPSLPTGLQVHNFPKYIYKSLPTHVWNNVLKCYVETQLIVAQVKEDELFQNFGLRVCNNYVFRHDKVIK